jgi:uncharacterized protein YdeI (YjbR/CyaY-like superfamily)
MAKEVDKYIDELPAFAQAICKKLRSIILSADKELKEEWKWGPHYSLNGMVCGFSGFKEHAKLTFFNGSEMTTDAFNHCVDNDFSRSIKFTDVSQVNEKEILALVKQSIAVNKKGFKRVVKDKTVEVPDDLQKALSKNKKAAAFFDGLTYGYKKEFVEYVTTAKREQTRLERIEKVVAMSADGKRLNDKYK